MPTCKTKPPPGQDIKLHLDTLKDIVEQLNASNDKKRAIERLNLMITAVKSAVLATNPTTTF